MSLPPSLSDADAVRSLPIGCSRGLNISVKARHGHLGGHNPSGCICRSSLHAFQAALLNCADPPVKKNRYRISGCDGQPGLAMAASENTRPQGNALGDLPSIIAEALRFRASGPCAGMRLADRESDVYPSFSRRKCRL